MRRTAAAVGFTVVGLWLVLSFKSSPLHSTSSLSAAAPSTTVAAPPDDNGGQPAAAAPPPTQPTTNTTARPSGTQTLTGDVVSNRYGEVQVAVVVQGTRILDVKALRLPFDRSRSQEISNQAAPLLRSEVLSAQSAQIDTISGATYTSDSYAQSLQSALDRARA